MLFQGLLDGLSHCPLLVPGGLLRGRGELLLGFFIGRHQRFDDPRSGHALDERRSGKLKVVRFASSSRLADKRDRSRPGSLGYSQYTWRTSDVEGLWKQVQAGGATQVTDVLPDEFGELAFSFVAPDGYSWTLLQA